MVKLFNTYHILLCVSQSLHHLHRISGGFSIKKLVRIVEMVVLGYGNCVIKVHLSNGGSESIYAIKIYILTNNRVIEFGLNSLERCKSYRIQLTPITPHHIFIILDGIRYHPPPHNQTCPSTNV